MNSRDWVAPRFVDFALPPETGPRHRTRRTIIFSINRVLTQRQNDGLQNGALSAPVDPRQNIDLGIEGQR